jgi:hypothetical protein
MPAIVSLGLPTVELLWEHLGLGRIPAPFEIPSVGATLAERAERRAAMWRDLTSRGLVTDGRPAPGIAAMLTVLARGQSVICSFGIMDGRLTRAMAATDGDIAVLAVQTARNVHIAAIEPGELPNEIVHLLPAARPFPARPVTVPDTAGEDGGMVRAPTAEDSDGEQAARMLAGRRVRAGYFTARRRDDSGTVHTSTALAWVDTDRGRFSSRFVVDAAGRRYTAHTPVGRDDLVTQLAALLADLSGTD